MSVQIIFPNQLFKNIPTGRTVYIIEDPLFFCDSTRKIPFNLLKLIYQRSCMKAYEEYLKLEKYKVVYIDYNSNVEYWYNLLAGKEIHIFDTCDFLLESRIEKYSKKYNIKVIKSETPYFICSSSDLEEYRNKYKGKLFNKTFYEYNRKKRNILMTKTGEPEGGKFSYDSENRKKLSGSLVKFAEENKINIKTVVYENKQYDEAIKYCELKFKNYYPHMYKPQNIKHYPITHTDAYKALENFLKQKLEYFGEYEDYIDDKNNTVFHSVLSPMINIGLLTPTEVLEATIKFNIKNKPRLESVEGFIRQLFWREYMRLVYKYNYDKLTTTNYLDNQNKIGIPWYKATTGINPLDLSIKWAFETGYLHHIMRLMIVCNFMNLCGINPDDCYKWFMAFSLDSYDWVMIGNVYGMGLYADGGTITTKPYVSSSAYILRMSNIKKDGIWDVLWTDLYHKFVKDNYEKIKGRGSFIFTSVRDKKMSDLALERADKLIEKLIFSKK